MPVFFLLSEYAVVKALKPLLWPLFLLTYEIFLKRKKTPLWCFKFFMQS